MFAKAVLQNFTLCFLDTFLRFLSLVGTNELVATDTADTFLSIVRLPHLLVFGLLMQFVNKRQIQSNTSLIL